MSKARLARQWDQIATRVTRWLALELRGGVGARLRALYLQDTGVTKTAISGLELYGSFGPRWVF